MAEKKYLDLNGLSYFIRKINKTKADIESPVFTGTPTAPTANEGDNSTCIATTAFVQTEIENNAKSYIAGDGISIDENNVISCIFANGMEVKY